VRLAFLGTPEAAVVCLRALVEGGHDVRVVVTRPDRRRGRGGALTPSPVKRAALELGVRVSDDLADVASAGVERGVVVAYGAMIPAALLAEVAMLNVHFSLLPRWRGAAPVARAILAGDEETGVDVMGLEATLDTGPIFAEARTTVDNKTLSELTDELAHLGATTLLDVLASDEVLAHPRPQVGEATYAKKLDAETFRVDPSMHVDVAARIVRLERTFLVIGGRRLRVCRAHAIADSGPAGRVSVGAQGVITHFARGSLVLDEVQPDGKRPMASTAWWAGARLDSSTRWE
jgi:methionyl-tRNA formyltransferase